MAVLEVTLDNLEERTESKRKADNYTEEDIANEINQDKSSEQETNYETSKTVANLKLPKKGGAPAFSIHAQKVYILYPSLFQDPNIFGRFSIPQNVNLDQPSTKALMQSDSPAPQNQDESSFADNLPSTSDKRIFRRQAKAPKASAKKAPAKKEEQKKNVETHLTGSIVVLNQDVNEFNRNDAY